MVATNLQFSLSGSNGVFLTNSSPNSSSIYGAPISQKLIVRVVRGYPELRNSPIFCFRKQKISFINALPDGKVDTYSASSHLLENEFKFCPTFDEYVKVLESVKTDRRRIISEERDVHDQRKKLVCNSKAESVREKGNFSKLKNHWNDEKHSSEGKFRDSKDTLHNPLNAKSNVAEKKGSAWALVEGILEKKAKEERAERRRGQLERVNEDLNSVKGVRKNFYKKDKSSGKYFHDEIIERKRKSQRAEEWNENHLKFMSLDKLESSKVVKSGIGRSYNGKSRITPFEAVKDLNGQSIGLHKKKQRTEEVNDNEFLENKRASKLRVKGTKEYLKDLRSLDEMGDNHITDELGYGNYRKSNNSKIFRYGGYNNDNMVSQSVGSNFSKFVRKYESSSSPPNMKATVKPTSGKMVALRMEGNQPNRAINAVYSDFYTPTTEIYRKGGNSCNSKFHDTTGAEKIYSRALISPGRSGRTDMAYPDASEGGKVNVVALEDRAAFKSFEVFTDVNNRPRVLRMEMEEKIRNLAKWLNASDLNMPEWQFSKMIHSTKIKFSEHSILKIVQILGSFGNWRRVLQVIEWFHSRERFKYYKSRYIYTTALDVLGKAKRPMEALNIFYAMRQGLSSYPDLAAYHCIAVTLGQAGLMKELFDVIDCMRAAPTKKFDLGPLQKWDPRLNPDIVVYNAVLNACVQQKQWEGAFWVLQELKRQGIRPSSTTYGLIMEVMFECGKYNLVYEFFWKLQKNSIPGALNYKVLVNTLWREGKIEDAVQAVKDMERRGIVGCASLYYDLARCLCSSGRCEEALQQINKICKVAKKPLVVTYTGLIQACLDSGSIENAANIFNQMNSFCSPNVITCNIMLKSYIQYRMFEEAKDLFEKILSGSREISRKDELNHKVLPDKFSFNTMIEASVASSKWDDFENFYLEMLHHGYHFDERRHMRLVFDAWRAGKKNILEITWNHLIGNGRAPPPAMSKELFCAKIDEAEPAAALSFIAAHQDMEIKAFSEDSWLNLLKRRARSLSSKTLAALLYELEAVISESARPHPVHQNLLNACREFGSRFGGTETRSSCNSETASK